MGQFGLGVGFVGILSGLVMIVARFHHKWRHLQLGDPIAQCDDVLTLETGAHFCLLP
jgi:hypothetical protein